MKAYYAPHPNVELPSDLDAKIWRYCDLAKLITILDRKALFFPSSTILPDPFEGLYSRPIVDEVSSIPQGALMLTAWRRMKRTVYVNSWHLNQYESEAMWRLYGSEGGGVAIQSTISRLIGSFPELPQPNLSAAEFLQVHIGIVRYYDYETDPIPFGNLFIPYLAKRKHFDHERELRAIAWRPDDLHLPGAGRNGLFIDTALDTLIENLYVSPFAPQYCLEAVQAVCTKYELTKPIIQSDSAKPPAYYSENA